MNIDRVSSIKSEEDIETFNRIDAYRNSARINFDFELAILKYATYRVLAENLKEIALAYESRQIPNVSAVSEVAFEAIEVAESRILGDTARAKKAANQRHDKPGGSRSKRDEIRMLWASGKYATRDRCAEEECRALNMSISTARKALRGTPDPT